MKRFLITSFIVFLLYLVLTIPSGTLFLWTNEELIIGANIALKEA